MHLSPQWPSPLDDWRPLIVTSGLSASVSVRAWFLLWSGQRRRVARLLIRRVVSSVIHWGLGARTIGVMGGFQHFYFLELGLYFILQPHLREVQ